MRVLRAADHRRMAWKNGGGETLEVAVHPADAGVAAFGWRVSIATVAAGGPFSVFAGVERTLTVLSGEGIELSIEDVGTRLLTPATLPLTFPGDTATTARLLGGAVTDLNVMTRRGLYTHRVMSLGAAPVEGVTLVVAAAASVLETAAGPLRLGPLDACMAEGPGAVRCTSGRVYAIAIAVAASRPQWG